MAESDSTGATHKRCTRCGDTKLLVEFGKFKRGQFGLRPTCKVCRQAECAAWRAANPDYRARYYEKNKTRESAVERAHTALGLRKPRRGKEEQQAYYQANKERLQQASLKWARKHAGKAAARTRMRQCRMRQATPAWANSEAIRHFYVLAQELTTTTGIKHHVDHIVPLAGESVCGLHVEWNLQVLSFDQNIRKSNRHWPDMP
jgi:hypothetical protein